METRRFLRGSQGRPCLSPGRHIWALGGVGGRQEVGLSELLDRPAPRSAGGVFSSLCESSLGSSQQSPRERACHSGRPPRASKRMLPHALIFFCHTAVFKASQVLWAAFLFIWKEGSGAPRLRVGHESCI